MAKELIQKNTELENLKMRIENTYGIKLHLESNYSDSDLLIFLKHIKRTFEKAMMEDHNEKNNLSNIFKDFSISISENRTNEFILYQDKAIRIPLFYADDHFAQFSQFVKNK